MTRVSWNNWAFVSRVYVEKQVTSGLWGLYIRCDGENILVNTYEGEFDALAAAETLLENNKTFKFIKLVE